MQRIGFLLYVCDEKHRSGADPSELLDLTQIQQKEISPCIRCAHLVGMTERVGVGRRAAQLNTLCQSPDLMRRPLN